jgi:hypothetical protein
MVTNMDMNWMWRPYDDKARADEIAERKLAEHQAYLKQEEERRARQEEMQRQIAIAEAAQGAKEYADRQAAASMGLSQLPQYTMGQAQTALYDQMAQQAQAQAAQQKAKEQREKIVARLNELEEARSKKISDPNFKMAAMLAMAGQPGAMQSLLTLDAQKQLNGSKTGKTQSDMDTLEKSIMNDIFAISSTTDPNQRDKLMKMAKMLYSGQLQDMLDNNPGLVSRLGGVEGIEALLQGQSDNIDTAKQRAAWKKEYDKIMGMRYPTDAQKKRLSWLAEKLGL